MLFPVLRGGVVSIFTFAALQRDDFSHDRLPYSMISVTAPVYPEFAVANERRPPITAIR
jgi:hypothetical protein